MQSESETDRELEKMTVSQKELKNISQHKKF